MTILLSVKYLDQGEAPIKLGKTMCLVSYSMCTYNDVWIINVIWALYIFTFLEVNAADNKQRDPSMGCIKITVDA